MVEAELIWMRSETRATERRAPLTPADAGRLVAAGLDVRVERSPNRAFADSAYSEWGCRLVPAGSWQDAPTSAWILGLKELPAEPQALTHRHVFFGHAFKGQPAAEALLRRFQRGGGALYDIEAMTDGRGRRVAAFGYWAGYVGAALGVLALADRLGPLEPTTRAVLDRRLGEAAPAVQRVSSLVIGAKGRCGRGALEALAAAGLAPVGWDVEETRLLDRARLLSHQLLINAVGITGKSDPFLRPSDLPGALQLAVDITCDLGSASNALPIYESLTSWDVPVSQGAGGVRIIAIDNLPSLLPREASTDFSAALVEQLREPGVGTPWRSAAADFERAMSSHSSRKMANA